MVSLSPSYLSMIEAVGGTVVGRASSKVGKIPESMKSVPEVGMVYNINMEALVGLKPDLVLASKNSMINLFRCCNPIKSTLWSLIPKPLRM